MTDAVLVGYVRTPFGKADPQRGVFRNMRSDDLAAVVLQEILRRTDVAAGDVDGVVLGAVEMMGEQAHPGTAIPFLAGFPPHVTGLSVERACTTALAAARHLNACGAVQSVCYPGLAEHPDHELARKQFGDRFGSLVTFTLAGGTSAASAFMRAAERIPFCPSLGELNTTLSHPESTSHRGLSAADRAALGITGGTIRLSVGIESTEAVLAAIDQGLAGLA